MHNNGIGNFLFEAKIFRAALNISRDEANFSAREYRESSKKKKREREFKIKRNERIFKK